MMLLEKLIHKQVSLNLESEGYFTQHQHGFHKNHSTMHAVLQLINYINRNMDVGRPTAAIFIDFRKAFDCVSHSTVVDKMRHTNMGENALNWFTSYLQNRKQRVFANKKKSELASITQGVPQGSILGPLMYILYANDIPEYMDNEVMLSGMIL